MLACAWVGVTRACVTMCVCACACAAHSCCLQVAGYQVVNYPGLGEDAKEHYFLDMPVDLMHRSHTTPGHVCGVGDRMIQRKLVVHMEHMSQHKDEKPVDWTKMMSPEEVRFLGDYK
jgi:hypothetical protein